MTFIGTDSEQIRQTVDDWALFRDTGDWERFATVWHDDGWMTATWFQGPATEFIERSRRAAAAGSQILHLLGGHTSRVRGDRGIAHTKMTILQRGVLDGVEVDVACIGRFYDFFERRDDRWAIVRRQPIYDFDRLDPVDPAAGLILDAAQLQRFPSGYRHLGYLQVSAGQSVLLGLPCLHDDVVQNLYREGEDWLSDATSAPGTPVEMSAAPSRVTL